MSDTRAKSTVPGTARTVVGMSNELLSPADTRRVLGVSDRRLRTPDVDRRLQPIRAGRYRVYRYDAVQAELDRRIEKALARKDGR